MSGDDMSGEATRAEGVSREGGEPACMLDQVCPACGRVRGDRGAAKDCAECAAHEAARARPLNAPVKLPDPGR
jgi:hypothetical protein